MGSKAGYEYRYEFVRVHEDEITSKYKLNRKPGSRSLLFEFRTKFILKTSAAEEREVDSETFDGDVNVEESNEQMAASLLCMISYRLVDYWMTPREIKSLIDEALAFAANDPVPIAVRLDVCTVQRAGEPYDAALERAITARNLVPLYLWPQPTIAVPKPMSVWVLCFLKGLKRVRVDDEDVVMRECGVCKQGPAVVGAHISVLAGSCNHAFHSKCIVRHLEDTNLCPLCHVPAYPHSIALLAPIIRPQDLFV